TNCDDGHALAEQIAGLGIEVAAVVDQRCVKSRASKWPVLTSGTVLEARGRSHLRAVHVARLAGDNSVEAGSEQVIACDVLCLASAQFPANELLLMAGVQFRHENGSWLPDRLVPGILAAGAAAGTRGLDAQVQESRERGAEAAALALGKSPSAGRS